MHTPTGSTGIKWDLERRFFKSANTSMTGGCKFTTSRYSNPVKSGYGVDPAVLFIANKQ